MATEYFKITAIMNGTLYQNDGGTAISNSQFITVVQGEATKVYFIVNTLGYSRRFHFWGTDSLDADTPSEGLIYSFEYFRGVTEEVSHDVELGRW